MIKQIGLPLCGRPILSITRMITDRIYWNPLSPVTITNNLYVYLALSFKGGKILPDWYENLWRPVGFTTIFLKGILR